MHDALPHPRTGFSRRLFIGLPCSLALGGLATAFDPGATADDELIMVEGWVVKRADLPRAAR